MAGVKSAAEVAAKMAERAGTAGKYLKLGLEAAEDPIEKLARDPKGNAEKLAKGVAEAVRTGAYEAGIKKAAANGSWGKSIPRAAAHFEERVGDMVANAMVDYEDRAKAIEAAKKQIDAMPTTTRDQRIAKSQAYLKIVAGEFDKVYGRKA